MRKLNAAFTVLVWSMAIIVLAAFFWLLWDVVSLGAAKLDWNFLSKAPKRSGREGGIFPMLVSTVLILTVAITLVLPIGLGCAIWMSEFARRDQRFQRYFGTVLDILAGVPSIVFGLFGYAFFCGFLDLGFSILSGGLTLACMMLPILIRSAEIGLVAVPDDWRRAGAALSLSRTRLLINVILPYAAPAITAGLLLAVGRATAETAALIFTSGYVDRMPSSLHDSGRALAVHIYDLSMNVLGGDKAAYGTALVLIALIMIINVGANLLSEFWLAKKVHR
ncbi:MAG: phosphate ABC transporter permease PstA [Burkholderiaceae bacterium]|nr:phosphate ABC transporter permease PstA [Burkholderiaceae bacterium]